MSHESWELQAGRLAWLKTLAVSFEAVYNRFADQLPDIDSTDVREMLAAVDSLYAELLRDLGPQPPLPSGTLPDDLPF